MLREIDAHRVQGDIAKLVSFGTRHTLSSQTDPNRGIGAARDWIYDQFQSCAAASGGRMTVQKQSFVQPPGPRNPDPVTVTNLVATLRGTQPESANRIYVVSGHYDSRCTDVLNFTRDAPGGDDDASGVAAVLELARVMAKRQFDATIVFMAVAGEELGLYGSTFSPSRPRRRAWTSRGCSPTTSSAARPATRGGATRSPCACSPKASRRPRRRSRPPCASRSAARTTGPRASFARYVKEVGENSATGMRVR